MIRELKAKIKCDKKLNRLRKGKNNSEFRIPNSEFYLAITLMLTILVGCRPVDSKVAFFPYKGDDTFISELMDYMAGNIPEGVSFVVRDAGNSQAVQNQQIVELIDGGFDLFVINAVDRLACSSIVEKCEREGIPVIFFNREPLEDALTGSNVYYVGAAADSLGEKQADIAAGLFGEDFAASRYDSNGDGIIQLAILKGEQGHQDAEKRTDNCVARLKALNYQVQVLDVSIADWERQKAYEAMRSLYSQFGGEIELLFCNNDDMALGAIDYLLDAGIFSLQEGAEQPFAIIGVDGTKVGLEAVEKGLLYGTVQNDSSRQADAILTLARYVMEGRSVGDFPYAIVNGHYIYVDGDIITRENVSEYIR